MAANDTIPVPRQRRFIFGIVPISRPVRWLRRARRAGGAADSNSTLSLSREGNRRNRAADPDWKHGPPQRALATSESGKAVEILQSAVVPWFLGSTILQSFQE